ncbi:hypothetical protein EIN_065980 [Entamoeba invadens IP1]|uniref:Uncharacterized protein n=1 Tax=Entamoeba invadens IP1 TaxID=370355 RepID=A0A0A1U098_ENTIV|nr:hypothetical protein EIN_065980 [Entamoeba invadens IP1]ELP84313.1 hypothetical protein EIN_065980 [Entamoeba invadens IP1]|eukprot:XP_004183659.1 hypothetical protein EIN_065980 [Entamoeba invadens IP1]
MKPKSQGVFHNSNHTKNGDEEKTPEFQRPDTRFLRKENSRKHLHESISSVFGALEQRNQSTFETKDVPINEEQIQTNILDSYIFIDSSTDLPQRRKEDVSDDDTCPNLTLKTRVVPPPQSQSEIVINDEFCDKFIPKDSDEAKTPVFSQFAPSVQSQDFATEEIESHDFYPQTPLSQSVQSQRLVSCIKPHFSKEKTESVIKEKINFEEMVEVYSGKRKTEKTEINKMTSEIDNDKTSYQIRLLLTYKNILKKQPTIQDESIMGMEVEGSDVSSIVVENKQ